MLQLEKKLALHFLSEYVQGFCNTESKRENNVLVRCFSFSSLKILACIRNSVFLRMFQFIIRKLLMS